MPRNFPLRKPRPGETLLVRRTSEPHGETGVVREYKGARVLICWGGGKLRWETSGDLTRVDMPKSSPDVPVVEYWDPPELSGSEEDGTVLHVNRARKVLRHGGAE